MTAEHVEVLIVGAGLSGIGAGYQLEKQLPGTAYTILESRERLGGTWDLFRYPGVRSDSDMHTLGYRFRPWTQDRAIADGGSILGYLQDTAREGGVEKNIRYSHRVVTAAWSSQDARWAVEIDTPSGRITMSCTYLFSCSGYYDYDQGYSPAFPGLADFGGTVVHPQFWPEDLDYAGKQVVVIGSGATAVTLVPAMTGQAAHVTMLQRSPTWIAALPGEDPITKALQKVLPNRAAMTATRWKNIGMFVANYQLSRRRPKAMKALLRKGLQQQKLTDAQIDEHFTPRYDPWDQRLCVVPDGDLFQAINAGTAEVVTDTIDTFTPTGIRLSSGRHLEADVVVTATGLQLKLFGGLSLTVDGEPVDLPHTLGYKAVMVSGVPNFFFGLGYTNASWTLKMDLTYEFLLRVIRRMRANGETAVVPRRQPGITERPLLDFKAGYVLRSMDAFPKQGDRSPWQLKQNYLTDLYPLRYGSLDDGVLEFTGAKAPAAV
jgi:monooxygenase